MKRPIVRSQRRPTTPEPAKRLFPQRGTIPCPNPDCSGMARFDREGCGSAARLFGDCNMRFFCQTCGAETKWPVHLSVQAWIAALTALEIGANPEQATDTPSSVPGLTNRRSDAEEAEPGATSQPAAAQGSATRAAAQSQETDA